VRRVDSQRTFQKSGKLQVSRAILRKRGFGVVTRLTGMKRQLPAAPDLPVFESHRENARVDGAELESIILAIVPARAIEEERAIEVRNTTEIGKALSRAVVVIGDGVDAFKRSVAAHYSFWVYVFVSPTHRRLVPGILARRSHQASRVNRGRLR